MGSSPWPSASSSISLIKAGPAFTPSAQSAPGPKPVTRLGWVGQGLGPRAKGAGLGHPLLWERVPSPQHGPGQRPPCPPGPRLWGGRFEDLMGCPPPASPTIPHFVPSRGPGAQPGLAGAAATVQCVGQWAVEPDVGVGEGGADGIRCVGRGVVGGSWLRKGLDGNVSNSRDWPGVRFGVSPVS